jgi:hypothetical protein
LTFQSEEVAVGAKREYLVLADKEVVAAVLALAETRKAVPCPIPRSSRRAARDRGVAVGEPPLTSPSRARHGRVVPARGARQETVGGSLLVDRPVNSAVVPEAPAPHEAD